MRLALESEVARRELFFAIADDKALTVNVKDMDGDEGIAEVGGVFRGGHGLEAPNPDLDLRRVEHDSDAVAEPEKVGWVRGVGRHRWTEKPCVWLKAGSSSSFL